MNSNGCNLDHLPHYLSLGAGVQSSTIALMYAAGELSPMPTGAIFADTGAEPATVYRWLEWLTEQLPYPVHRVAYRNLETESLKQRVTSDGRRYTRTEIPVYSINPNGGDGAVRTRTCTVSYKVRPIAKALRRLVPVPRGSKEPVCVSVIGISLDECHRMKPSRDPWCTHRWPLIEHRIRRQQCIEWMESRGYPRPPRSACRFCPFHSNREWRRLQVEEPDEFARAVAFEKALQKAKAESDNFDGIPYLHNSRRPLDEIDFRSDVEHGQLLLWDDECEGMCGI